MISFNKQNFIFINKKNIMIKKRKKNDSNITMYIYKINKKDIKIK